jgi:hypothetical protein
MAHSDGRHFDGRPSLSERSGSGWTCSLLVAVAINTRQSQDGTVRKGLALVQAQRNHSYRHGRRLSS